PLLILDEPTTGLDTVSEELIFDALGRLMKNTTCIVIAHRLATVNRSDVIFVVKDSTIVERGSHQELLNAAGLYSELIQLQIRQEHEGFTESAIADPLNA